ncbi:MAG: hypothetical protein WCR06_11940 [bacterium]
MRLHAAADNGATGNARNLTRAGNQILHGFSCCQNRGALAIPKKVPDVAGHGLFLKLHPGRLAPRKFEEHEDSRNQTREGAGVFHLELSQPRVFAIFVFFCGQA